MFYTLKQPKNIQSGLVSGNKQDHLGKKYIEKRFMCTVYYIWSIHTYTPTTTHPMHPVQRPTRPPKPLFVSLSLFLPIVDHFATFCVLQDHQSAGVAFKSTFIYSYMIDKQ